MLSWQVSGMVDTHAMAVNSQDRGVNTLDSSMSSDTGFRNYPALCMYGVMLLVLQTTLPLSVRIRHGEQCSTVQGTESVVGTGVANTTVNKTMLWCSSRRHTTALVLQTSVHSTGHSIHTYEYAI